jgi:hypothetical protein
MKNADGQSIVVSACSDQKRTAKRSFIAAMILPVE